VIHPGRTRIAGICSLAVILALFAQTAPAPASAAQVRAVTVSVRQAAGRVVFCVTKDTILIAAVDGGSPPSSRLPGDLAPHPPAVVPLGNGRVGVVMGATDWMRDSGKPTLLDQELPALLRKASASSRASAAIDPRNPTADDLESIGVTVLEFLRPFVTDIHYKLDLAADQPIVEIFLAGFTAGYGPEVWDLKYRVQQRDLEGGYWDTRPLRPSYYQLYPPEKGQPRTFIESRYPDKLAPLNLAAAARSDPAVSRIRGASQDVDQAVTNILNGESAKANTRPTEDFLRLAVPAIAGAEAKLAVAALDQFLRFQWVLAPENAPPAPAETSAQPSQPGGGTRTIQTDRPSLGRGGPATTR
jgi:hypothetical protein